MLPFIFGCVSFQYDGFPPNQLQRTKEKQPKTNRQANKQELKNRDQETRMDLHIIASELQEEYTKGTNKQYEITAMLRFPQRANDKTTYTNQAHYCVPRK